jgi:hypothetical protein
VCAAAGEPLITEGETRAVVVDGGS